ncbi:MAG: phenylacetate--CoA ligase family protein [Deltaproteobacteria bacterium]|nr:phenylacetate--CoA ligase family protein [Deltaproteobacteria bacterium]
MIREFLLSYPYLQRKKLIRRTEYWPTDKLKELQGSFLLGILRYAAQNIPYYQKMLDLNELNHTTEPYELLAKFPLIDKKEIRKHLNSFVRGNRIRKLRGLTGGSSGQVLIFYCDRFTTRQREKAFIFDQWSRVGYKLGDSIFSLRARTPPKDQFVQHDHFFNIYHASSFDISKLNIKKYVYYMNKIQPKFLHGYPSIIYQIALLLERCKNKLNFNYKAVLCGSEKLFDYQRKKIESVFTARVYSWYGHSEYLALGGECEHSQTLHFYPQYGYTELLPTGTKNEEGKEIYELVATGFNNQVMPLIRYRTGDYATLSENQSCKCNRNYLIIDEVIGREQEFFVDANGSLISATVLIDEAHYDVFMGLESFWIHQDTPGVVEIFLVKNERYQDELFHLMKNEMEALVGDRLRLHFSFVDKAQKTPSGKAKVVHQELDISSYLRNIT